MTSANPQPLSLLDHVLVLINAKHVAGEPLSQTAMAEKLGKSTGAINISFWTLRQKGLLTPENQLTDEGRAHLATLIPDSEVQAQVSPPPKQAEKKPRGRPATKATSTAVAIHMPSPAPTSRADAVHKVGDGIVANSHATFKALREYLAESVEASSLLTALLDAHAGALQLADDTYRAAR